MIIGGSKKDVIENIKKAILDNELNRKVETSDPNISDEKLQEVLNNFFKLRENKALFKVKAKLAKTTIDKSLKDMNSLIEIEGVENIANIKDGAIVTSNHFNPFENLTVKKLIKTAYGKDLCTVVQDTNLAMDGMIGYLFNHMNVLPVSKSVSYITNTFKPLLKEMLNNGEYILIYPEEEMWFNYRKPRPCKRGAYTFAAEANKPIISCFVEIIDTDEDDNEEFKVTKYIIHVLKPIFPNPDKSVRSNSIEMAEIDYKQKCEAYEKFYGKSLDYSFDISDIAGWKNS